MVKGSSAIARVARRRSANTNGNGLMPKGLGGTLQLQTSKGEDTYLNRVLVALRSRSAFLSTKLQRTEGDVKLLEDLQKKDPNPQMDTVRLILNNDVNVVPPEMDGVEDEIQLSARGSRRTGSSRPNMGMLYQGQKKRMPAPHQELAYLLMSRAKAPITAAKLAKRMAKKIKGIKKNRASQVLHELNKKGLVTRTADGWSLK